MMTAEQFYLEQNHTHQWTNDFTGTARVGWEFKFAESYAAAQLAEKERLYEDADKNFEEANARAEAAEERLKEAQAFVCASLGIDHDEEAGYMVIAEPEPMEAGDTFEEAIGEYVQFNNKCDEDLRERLRQREAEQRWIAVEDKLPEKRGQYLVWVRGIGDGGEMVRCSIEAQFDMTSWRMRGGWLSHEVQGWQPLPSPPKVQP